MRVIALKQTCKACGRPDILNFHVDDATWAAVVPTALQKRVVCLPCFDGMAADSGVDYWPQLADECHFYGRAGWLVLRVEARGPVTDDARQ
jgi:hypothetical protein